MADNQDTMHQVPSTPGGMMMGTSDSLGLIAYRLGELEKSVGIIGGKFDKVADLYVNHASLVLILDPLKTNIRELQEAKKEEEKTKDQASAQLRLAIVVAIVSAVFTPIATILIYGAIK